MGRALATLGKYIHRDSHGLRQEKAGKIIAHLGEGFWMIISLILFVALGPFAILPAFMALLSLSTGEESN